MTKYNHGKVDYFDMCCIDKLSLLKIYAMLKEYSDLPFEKIDIWYRSSLETKGMHKLLTDSDVLKMGGSINQISGYVEVFTTTEKEEYDKREKSNKKKEKKQKKSK